MRYEIFSVISYLSLTDNFTPICTALYSTKQKFSGCGCWQWISSIHDTITIRVSSIVDFSERTGVSNGLVRETRRRTR